MNTSTTNKVIFFTLLVLSLGFTGIDFVRMMVESESHVIGQDVHADVEMALRAGSPEPNQDLVSVLQKACSDENVRAGKVFVLKGQYQGMKVGCHVEDGARTPWLENQGGVRTPWVSLRTNEK